jgi:predicted transcriptional regulator
MEEKKKRMRSINDALKMIKEDDPNTAVTYYLIKNLCDKGTIKYIRSGKKYIINFDELCEYLNMC